MEHKLREISGSLVVTIPKQVCDLYDFKDGDMFSIEPIGVGELILRNFRFLGPIYLRLDPFIYPWNHTWIEDP